MKHFSSLLLIFSLFIGFNLCGQVAPDSLSIDTQFDKLILKSNNWKGYEIVVSKDLFKLRDNTLNKISELKAKNKKAKKALEKQSLKISKLQSSLNSKSTELKTIQENAKTTLLGIPVRQSTFKATMWIIIIILIAALVLFVYKYKNSHVRTQEAEEKYNEKEEELEEHRKKSLEMQQEMGKRLKEAWDASKKDGDNRPES